MGLLRWQHHRLSILDSDMWLGVRLGHFPDIPPALTNVC